MADAIAEAELEPSGQIFTDQHAFFAMERLQATLQHLECVLRQRDVSEASSTEYCDNFCQALMHYAGSRNAIEHGLTLLEVYCVSINCFALARPHLTASSSSVALVLKRLALSCFELILSVPQNEIPLEAWLQFHGFVQAAHDAMLDYGSTDLQALVQITGEGGAWRSHALVSLLTGQPMDEDEVNAYLSLEGEDFLEMRIKHLEKVGEMEKAMILTKACGNCRLLSSQATFLKTFVSQLCQKLPNEEAILEISKLDAKDVLDMICNMETERNENTALILCTTYLTQQMQQGNLYCSWELTLLWSKLQRRLDGSLDLFLERCLQLGTIAKTVFHLLFLIRVIQTETMDVGLAVSIELCVKALQIPRQEEAETKTAICRTVTCLVLDDLEVLRACQLTEFLLNPSQEVFTGLEDLYKRPDQKYDAENSVIPNSLRCELLLALKAHWSFDPEFWDWNTLRHYCIKFLGPEADKEDSPVLQDLTSVSPTGLNPEVESVEEKCEVNQCSLTEEKKNELLVKDEAAKPLPNQNRVPKKAFYTSERSKRWLQYKFLCKICQVEVVEPRFCHHARKHMENDVWTCPVCLQKFEGKQEFLPHSKKHLQMPAAKVCHMKRKKVKKKLMRYSDDFAELEPGEIRFNPSFASAFVHMSEEVVTVPKEAADNYITFDYIYTHFKLQNRELFPCPATDCSRDFKLFKYLGVHLKNDHTETDQSVKHYVEMNNRREKCTFCRRTFITAHHLQVHRSAHYGDNPYICVVAGCNARFDSINKLVKHKHGHGFRLSYHCQLKDCSLSFCDLGQLYHHEAQHFRDAAYTCTSPGCKKFYYCRQEFLKHLDTHGVTFTEEDFEAQRKVKRGLLLPVVEEDAGSGLSCGSKDYVNGKQVLSQNLLPSQHLEGKDVIGTSTCVTLCFDGKKFTCGLEKCGRTFSKAREIQKHLKTVHPDLFEKENTATDKRSKTKRDHSGPAKCPTQESGQEKAPLSVANSALSHAAPSKLATHIGPYDHGSVVTEIVQRLGQLSIHSTSSRSVQLNPCRHSSGSKVPQVTCLTTVNADPTTKVTSSKSMLSSHVAVADLNRLPLKTESPHRTELPAKTAKDPPLDGQLQNKLGPKPFECEVEGCVYKSVTSHSLMLHYVNKHGYSEQAVKRMDVFNPLKFKPFKCHFCTKRYKEKKELKAHFLFKHNISKNMVEEILCSVPACGLDTCRNDSMCLRDVSSGKEDVSVVKDGPLNGCSPNCGGDSERKNGNDTKDQSLRSSHHSSSHQSTCDGKLSLNGSTQEKTGTKRSVTKWKPPAGDPSEGKPYTCDYKDCGAGFVKQYSLLHHLKKVHSCNTFHGSSKPKRLIYKCPHKGCKKFYNHSSSLQRHTRRFHQALEEPIPRFKCTYAACNVSYHLKSSLMRHTDQVHQNRSQPTAQTSSNASDGEQNSHYNQACPLVVRLQSTCKREGSGSGCQKKLIITSTSQSLKVPQKLPDKQSLGCCSKTEENVKKAPDLEPAVKKKKQRSRATLAYRTPEEALQMCQDRCLPVAYPCMVQNCVSVVTSRYSLRRHYIRSHKMLVKILDQNEAKLFFTAEQLEELIQKKSTLSALPDLARVPNGVFKMKYQAKPDISGASCLPMSLHCIKTEPQRREALPSRESPSECSVLLGADDVLYGESNGHAEGLADKERPAQEDRLQNDSPAPPLDLSPPSTLRIHHNSASLDPPGRDSKPVTPAAVYSHAYPALTRQPLRWKNSATSEPQLTAPHPAAQEVMTPSLVPQVFNMGAYKSLDFESSFLTFIKENKEQAIVPKFDAVRKMVVLNPSFKADPPRRRNSFRHKYSVKENNLRTITHSRMSRLSPFKSLLSTEECSSIQNLRYILERALLGCGDKAIKQLQFLKPVVVLERPKSFPSASLLATDLLPSETQA